MKRKKRDVVLDLIEVAKEMQRQGLGAIKCGPHVETGLKISIVVTKASEKERARCRCKATVMRGGRTFQCRLSRRHTGRHCGRSKSSGNFFFEPAVDPEQV